ncbi:monoacylglycerol lipase ABHD6 [Gracilinanus agilis]|uniref:monoacylglycerol lipase ABHD6 n=1 Tax=Gracilinanus agilis TaxID=191870 RepID=UPI001CFE239F|nr:monoacylglycerol lipase ABHD6 [Gracilinanus agilis]
MTELDVLNVFIIAGGTLAIPILAFVASFLLWPGMLIKIYHWYWRRTLGLHVSYTYSEGYRFCYSYRGSPTTSPSLLMLHGFSSSKDMWLKVVKFLPKDIHLVCPDMPGHEGTTRSSSDDLSIDGQVKRIHQFVESIKLNKRPFHLVGTSMGGQIAGVYAAYYPSDICSLTLVCPAGLKIVPDNDFKKLLRELNEKKAYDKIPLVPTNTEEMAKMLSLCSYAQFNVPQQLLQGLVDVRLPNNDFYRKLFLEITNKKSRYFLQEHMDKIQAPTQIIWGKQDKVLDVAGADILAKAIPQSQTVLLENCGHSVVMERPRKTASLLFDFLNSVSCTDNDKKQD